MSKNTEIARSYPASYKPLANLAPYHIYNGSLALASTVSTAGFSTTLYTGNGGTQSINTGVDMSTQWGNDASETFGGLVWQKYRSAVGDNTLIDSVRGTGKYISSNTTGIQGTDNNSLTSFNNNGFSIGASWSANGVTAVSWNFQTTHRRTGTTNHGKAFTEHYNPFTGFTIIQYTGSGIAGHEIPHSLGRKLGFATIKRLNIAYDWAVYYGVEGQALFLNLTNATASPTGSWNPTSDTITVLASGAVTNNSGDSYILYGWANSYFDEANTLIGNYEIGIYQGTGASGNKVTTKGKPAWVMIKRLDSTGNWEIHSNQPDTLKHLWANLSNAESSADVVRFNANGLELADPSSDRNASGGQYLYMVVYDNDSGSGKSKYPKPSDAPVINLNATVPFANGIDGNGTKLSILSKNESVTGVSLSAGKNYVYSLSDGTYGRSSFAPQYGSYNGFGDYFCPCSNKWFSGVSVFSDDFSGTLSEKFDISHTFSGTFTAPLSATIVNGELKIVNNGATYGAVLITIPNFIVGKKYCVIANTTSYSSDFGLWIGTTDSNSDVLNYKSSFNNTIQTFVASASTLYFKLYNGNTSGAISTWDNIAVYPIKSDGTPDISGATPITSRNYLDAIVYADGTGNAEYIEQLPKTQYFDEVKANDYRGKNAITAWALIDTTVYPPTLKDSYNISSVIKTGTGTISCYFTNEMDTAVYGASAIANDSSTSYTTIQLRNRTTKSAVIQVLASNAGGGTETSHLTVLFFGGKN